MLKTIGIVARVDSEEAIKLAERTRAYLEGKGVSVVLEMSTASRLGRKGVSISELPADAVIVIGGDGTILKTCASLLKPKTPVLAINMGTKGLLTSIEPEAYREAVNRLLSGDYVLEECIKLAAWVGGERLPDALNEILLASRYMKMTLFNVQLSGEGSLTYPADALLISTPLGSTAHSYSAGGPVLHPSLKAFAVTPVCPLAPLRPLIVPSDRVLTIRLAKPSQVDVVIDGMYRCEMTERDVAVVQLSEHKACFVRLGPDSFYRRVRRKASGA